MHSPAEDSSSDLSPLLLPSPALTRYWSLSSPLPHCNFQQLAASSLKQISTFKRPTRFLGWGLENMGSNLDLDNMIRYFSEQGAGLISEHHVCRPWTQIMIAMGTTQASPAPAFGTFEILAIGLMLHLINLDFVCFFKNRQKTEQEIIDTEIHSGSLL